MIPQAQGDVYISPASSVPANATEVARDNGRIVLAYGEGTGHAHAIHAREAQLLVEPERSLEDETINARFLRVTGGLVVITPTSIDENDDGTFDVATTEGVYRVTKDMVAGMTVGAESVIDGVHIQHEERYREVLAPGDYRVTQQREYAPAALPRRVAD